MTPVGHFAAYHGRSDFCTTVGHESGLSETNTQQDIPVTVVSRNCNITSEQTETEKKTKQNKELCIKSGQRGDNTS